MPAESSRSFPALSARLDALERLHERDIGAIHKVANERDRRYEERFKAIQRETDLARIAMGDRLEGMNEIREQLQTQRATFASQELVAALAYRLTELERRMNLDTGKNTGVSATRAFVFSMIAAATSIVAIVVVLLKVGG